MADTVGEIRKVCGSELCSLFTVDTRSRKCEFINENGRNDGILYGLADSMNRTPYETAMNWEKDLESSDSLLLDDLSIIRERDPAWYCSLVSYGIQSIVLYAVRCQQELVAFIWAANFDTSKIMQIKETLGLTAFLIAAVIANHNLLSQLEEKSSIDALTQVNNRNAMNELLNLYVTGEKHLPDVLGIAFADLNGLKTVNDDEGHEAGDKLLIRASALLKIVFADYDIYRSGGDEFVILCPDITEEKLDELVVRLKTMAENSGDVSFAVGTSFCAGDYDIYKVMQNADERMYRDKREYYRTHPEKDRRKRKEQ